MIETKWTAGPWEIRNNDPEKSEGNWLVYNRAHSRWPIAVGLNKADAQLIAAAPDLYAALKDAMRTARKAFDTQKEFEAAYPEQVAALAKARGKREKLPIWDELDLWDESGRCKCPRCKKYRRRREVA